MQQFIKIIQILAYFTFIIFETCDIIYTREATILLASKGIKNMTKRSIEENEPSSSVRMIATSAYSARIQEAMRYVKLRSSDYPLVMSIMRAVSQGFTEEQWETEQQNIVRALREKPADQQIAHADAANRYEQTIAVIKDLALWPW